MRRAIALGGRRLRIKNNNQPDSWRKHQGGVRAEVCEGGERMGDTVPSFGEANGVEIFLRDGQGLGHQRPPNDDITHNNQPKTSGHDGGEYEGEARRARGAGEARYHRFGGALELMDVKNYNKIVEFTNYFFLGPFIIFSKTPRHCPRPTPFAEALGGGAAQNIKAVQARPGTGSTMVSFFVGWLLFRIEVFCRVAHIFSIKCSSQTV